MGGETKVSQTEIVIETPGRQLIDITAQIAAVVAASNVMVGLCHLFIQHTSASLIVSENNDPDVLKDLEHYISKLVQDGDADFCHTIEGPDDMSAHVRSVLTATDMTLPVHDGKLRLGQWQSIYLWEHRYMAKQRSVIVTLLAC